MYGLCVFMRVLCEPCGPYSHTLQKSWIVLKTSM